MLESNKGMDEDFLIISVDWHAGLYCLTKEGENQVWFPQTLDVPRMFLIYIKEKLSQ